MIAPRTLTSAEDAIGEEASRAQAPLPTIWGLDPIQLHTRYWAARGVQVVRQGEPSQIVSHAELYLLTDPRSLVLFGLSELMDVLNWIKPLVLFVRLADDRERSSHHRIATDERGRFAFFQHLDEATDDPGLARVVLTPDIEVARLWQSAASAHAGWRRLRRFTPRHDRVTLSARGHVFARGQRGEIALFVRELLKQWKRPDSVVARAVQWQEEIWRDSGGVIEPGAKFVGPVWVGAGRRVPAGTTVIGPSILWDDPASRPATEAIAWLQIEPAAIAAAGGQGNFWKNVARMIRKVSRS